MVLRRKCNGAQVYHRSYGFIEVRDSRFEVRKRESDDKSYKDLEVYQRSYETALKLHRMTLEFPKHELYELGSQMRRAATSIPLNIAEGYGRKSTAADFKAFLRIALGSCNEVMVLIEMIKRSRVLGKRRFPRAKRDLRSYCKANLSLIRKLEIIEHRASNIEPR